jgi:hypothetical protein
MSKTKSIRSHSAVGRFGYSNKSILSNPILESTVSTATTTKPHLVKTVGRGNSHDGIIPIASLFSSMDLIQPSTTTKKSSAPPTPIKRAASFYQIEPDNEQIPM